MRIILLFMIGLSFLWHNLVAASEPWQQNTQFLPQYCKDYAKRPGLGPEYSKWRGTLGDAYIHMNHYCRGVYAEQKARSTINQGERNAWLRSVIGEMRYVGNKISARCVLYPELHSRWGWALGEKGQLADALQHYYLVIKAKPKYTKAYAQLSDLYIKNKQSVEARKVLEAGLNAKPDSRMLQRRLQKLESAQ